MSERKVLNKYYPPDFDPSKIPRAKGSKNRQFTVRLMAPCNMKCYTCGEYIAKGKKFNARKEDVEDMTYIGIRIYRFYIKCPGCLSEISFRTDPASTDYIIEAGAHRNFQALKLAEEQAQREAQEVQDEIESNPMLLLENRTQQSQYEMDLLESLEDLRELNDRHAGVDLAKVASKYQKEKELTAKQKEEAEQMEALQAMGYEMVEGKLVKRLREEDLLEENLIKKTKTENWNVSDHLTGGKSSETFRSQNTLKAKLSGLVIKKKKVPTDQQTMVNSITASTSTSNGSCTDSLRMPPPLSRGLTSRTGSPSSSRTGSPSSSRTGSPSSSKNGFPSSSKSGSPNSSKIDFPSYSKAGSSSSCTVGSSNSCTDDSSISKSTASSSSKSIGSSSSLSFGLSMSSIAGAPILSNIFSPNTSLSCAVTTGTNVSCNNVNGNPATTSAGGSPLTPNPEPSSGDRSTSSSLGLLGAYSDSESDEED